MTRREEHLGADEQHGAVLGAGEEGQVVDTESVRLSWFQTNAPDHAVELAAFAVCMDEKTNNSIGRECEAKGCWRRTQQRAFRLTEVRTLLQLL